jgi:8-amino-7-oxononanoate synthase
LFLILFVFFVLFVDSLLMPFSELQLQLDERAARGLLRQRRTVSSPQQPQLVVDGTTRCANVLGAGVPSSRRLPQTAGFAGNVSEADGKPYLSFCSNDYLGLANNPNIIKALRQGAADYGVGAGAAHLVSGHFAPHEQLEQALAAFVDKPAAVLFSTGYMANLGVVQALAGRGDTVFADKLNHASLNDAMLLSRAHVKRYRHNDMAQLADFLGKTTSGRKLICTDAVFSMDGDFAPLPELLALCEKHDAWLLVDDAHGFGVVGEQGSGSLSHFGLVSPRIIYMATLGKAAGVFGAFVAAESVVINTLINQASSYIYTTATPPALSVALLESLRLISAGDERRVHLQKLIAQLSAGLADLPWALMPSDTAIQPLAVGENQAALDLSMALREQGLWVAAIRPPTVPEGTARLRITLSASHTAADVNRLLEALHELAR